MIKVKFLAAALAIVLGHAAPLAAQLPTTLSTSSGTLGADTSLSERQPTQNFGSNPTAAIGFSSFFFSPRNNIAILRFDLSELSEADRDALQSAALHVTDPHADDQARHLEDLHLHAWAVTDESEDTWDESTATWASGAPAHLDDGIPYNGPDLVMEKVRSLGVIQARPAGAGGQSQPLPFGTALAEAVRADTDNRLTLILQTETENIFYDSAIETRDGAGSPPTLELSAAPPPTPATPDYGTGTAGGTHGTVLKVTNLNPAGAGSLRAALEAAGPRLVVFEAGGVIDLGAEVVRVRHPHLTVAGHTAPPPGITLIRGGLRIATHDVVIQHIAVRPGEAGFAKGSGWEVDAITTQPQDGADVHHVVIDHCSLTWATDENLSAGSSADATGGISRHITFSHNIVAEGLADSTHSKGAHSMGTLIMDGCQHVAVVANLYAHNGQRNPQFKGGSTGAVLNNLVHNPGGYALRFRERGTNQDLAKPVATVVGNVHLPGADTTNGKEYVSETGGEGGEIFAADNLTFYPSGRGSPVLYADPTVFLESPPATPAGYQPWPATMVVAHLGRIAGSRPGDRSPVDARIVTSVLDRDGQLIDSQNEVGGYPDPAPSTRPLDVPAPGPAREAWLRTHEANVSAPGLPSWTTLHFTLAERADSRISGPLADPDGDRIPNLVEFATGTAPRAPNEPLFALTIENAGPTLHARFLRNPEAAGDVTFTLQSSAALATWQPVDPNTLTETTAAAGPGLELVTYSFTIPPDVPANAYRLRLAASSPW